MTSTKSKSRNFRQLKLSNCEEIVAEIIQWDNESDAAIIVRAAFKILAAEAPDGYRYFGFRPWMMYCEDPEHLMTINSDQVIGECYPAANLLEQYLKTVQNYTRMTEERLKAEAEAEAIKSVDVTEEMFDQIFNSNFEDSDGKVVSIFSRNKLH